MGMDVYGVEPASEAGRYYRASIWEWRPIWERMAVLCEDVIDESLLQAMTFNEGAGPRDQATCTQIAERLERWLSEQTSERIFWEHDSSILRVTPEGRFVSEEELAADPHLVTKSPYSISRVDLWEFVRFLKECGGFCVW